MPITVVSDPPDNELRAIADRVAGSIRVTSLGALEETLVALAPSDRPTSLDVVGHTTRDKLVRVGTTVLDPDDPVVSTSFARLARDGILARIAVRAIRLLGCESACGRGAGAVINLAHRVGLPVHGSTVGLKARHYDTTGFSPRFEVLLIDDVRLGGRAALSDLRSVDPAHRRTHRIPSAK